MATWSALSARHENECFDGGYRDSVIAHGKGFSVACLACNHDYEIDLDGEVTGYDGDEYGVYEIIDWDYSSTKCPSCQNTDSQDIDLGSQNEIELETI